MTKKKRKKKKKSDYHCNCSHSEEKNVAEDVCNNNIVLGEDDFEGGDRALLVHGIESDWVEEEMMEDDVDFIKDVLEQKVIKVLQKAGIKKKVLIYSKHLLSLY